MKAITNILVYLMVLTLLACGGGNSDNGGSPEGNVSNNTVMGTGEDGSGNTDVDSTPIAINQENGLDIASAVLSGIYTVGDREETIDLISGIDTTQTANKFVTAVVARAGGIDSRSVENFTLACDSGSIAYSTNDVNNDGELDTADTVSINFNNCVVTDAEDGTVFTSNGAVALQINSISADGASVNAAATYTNLVLSEDDYSSSINGSMTLDVQTTVDTTISTISGEKIDFIDDDATGILNNFSLSESFNEQTEVWTESHEAIMASTVIGGQVIIKSITEFQGVGDDFASTGELKIEGADGSFVALNADTGNVDTVLITISDGGATTSEEINWDDL